jgi:uncharacterized membrane protein
MKTICKAHPEFSEDKVLSVSELNHFRQLYIEGILKDEAGDLSKMDKDVLEKIRDNQVVSIDTEEQETGITWSQKLADKVAAVGGSWTFIIWFFLFMIVWMLINTLMVREQKAFDPYPFILLNLLLSTLAALQAPVIMMSQNRQEEKDRKRNKQDYRVNLKAELEIQLLHEKLDHLLLNQQTEMMEIQQIQIEMMDEIIKKLSKAKDKEQ